jgi:hypothetical protein
MMLMLLLLMFYTSSCIPDPMYAFPNGTMRCAFYPVFIDSLGHIVRITGQVASNVAIGCALFLIADEVGDTFGTLS